MMTFSMYLFLCFAVILAYAHEVVTSLQPTYGFERDNDATVV